MAYLNCPFCPAQAFEVDKFPLKSLSMHKYKCNGVGHSFFVTEEEVQGGKRQELESNVA